MLTVSEDNRSGNRPIEPFRPRSSEHNDKEVRRAGAPPTVREQHLRELIGILHRRRRMILVVAALGMMLATAVGLLIPPKYTATAAIIVNLQQIDGARAAPADESIIDTQVAMLTSPDHLDRVLHALAQDPAFRSLAVLQRPEAPAIEGPVGETLPQSDLVERSADPVMPAAGSLSLGELSRRLGVWMRPLYSGRGERFGAEQLARNLNVMQERRSRIITVKVTSPSPQQAAIIANRIVRIYVDDQAERKRASMAQELARIGDRIAELRKEIEGAQTSARSLVDQQLGSRQTAESERRGPDGRLDEFARKATLATQLQINLLRRQEDIRGQLEVITPDVSIQSLASPPERPSSPHPILFILPALIVCVIGASFFAVVLDRLDCGLRVHRDAHDALGIPCIGLIPRLNRVHMKRPCEYVMANPFSAYAYVIRSLAVALQLTMPQRTSTVLITSSVPGEGKSTLALTLAAYVAGLGRRVIVIDFHRRQGSALEELGATPNRRVLDSEMQDLSINELVRYIPHLGIDYLAMPYCRTDPLALFARQEMPQLLRQLQEGRDYVFIDGPPVLGIAESRLLAGLADRLLFVVKWGSTRREVAQNALRQLRDAGCFGNEWSEPPAAVITQVELEQHGRYEFDELGELLRRHRDYYSRSTAS